MEKTPLLKEEEIVMQQKSVTVNPFERDYADLVDLAVHDLDAPLRKLSVLVGMLTGKLSGDIELQSYIERIGGCVNDMRTLIDSLSLLAKMNSTDAHMLSCNIDTIVKESLQELPAEIKAKGAVITSDSLPVIEGDAALYTILFKHLLENAVKFNKKATAPQIHIQSSALAAKEKNEWNIRDERLYYKIEISDNGIGFKNEHAEKIFQPFVRLHGKSQYAGNGIGLAICKKITDIHQGIIYAEGRENEGARFVLILPESHQ